MKEFLFKHWFHLLWFSILVHVIYGGMVLVAAGTLLTKRTVAVALSTLQMDTAANILTASMLDLAREKTETIRAFSFERQAAARFLASEEEEPSLPGALKQFEGRGLMSDQDVIDIRAIEEEILREKSPMLPLKTVEPIDDSLPDQEDQGSELKAPSRRKFQFD